MKEQPKDENGPSSNSDTASSASSPNIPKNVQQQQQQQQEQPQPQQQQQQQQQQQVASQIAKGGISIYGKLIPTKKTCSKATCLSLNGWWPYVKSCDPFDKDDCCQLCNSVNGVNGKYKCRKSHIIQRIFLNLKYYCSGYSGGNIMAS